jgi:cob(I)alamin adenosyltransferase
MNPDIQYIGEERSQHADKGITVLLAGDGKGKTTAAIGMAIRAVGWNRPTIFIQLMKKYPYGEISILEELSEKLEVYQMGREEHVDKKNPSPEDIALAQRGIKMARESIESRQYDFIIVDEALTALEYGLVSEEDLLDLISQKPDFLNLILTGLKLTPELIEAADCVTRMEKVKHHFDAGLPAQKGIEY